MKALVLLVAFVLAAAPALAATIAPADARRHAGQTVTVEGVVSEVHHIASGREIFIAAWRPLSEDRFPGRDFGRRHRQVSGCGCAQRQDRRGDRQD